MGLLLGVALAVTALMSLRGASAASSALTRHVLPSEQALEATFIDDTQSQSGLLATLDAGTPAEASTVLAAAGSYDAASAAAWTSYKSVALNQPGEAKLQQAYEAARSRSHELGAMIFGGNPLNSPALASTVAQEKSAQAAAAQALGTLVGNYRSLARQEAAAAQAGVTGGRTIVLGTAGILGFLFAVVCGYLMIGARRDQTRLSTEALALRVAGESAQFEGSLQRGLEMAATEEASFQVVRRALAMVAPEIPTEFLLADSSQAHLRQVLSTQPDSESRCGAGSPGDCPAASSGQARFFEDSTELGTCPLLAERSPSWALCTPVSIGGRTLGVIHAEGVIGEGPTPDLVGRLDLVARKTGERVGALRVLARTEAQAQVDPLTGHTCWRPRCLEMSRRRSAVMGRPHSLRMAPFS